MSLLGLWLDGTPVEALPPQLRAAHYGDGVFRTMRRDAGTIALRAQHLDKLRADADALGIEIAPEALGAMLDKLALPSDAVLKICVWRGGAGRGYLPDAGAAPYCAVYAYSLPAYPRRYWSQGIPVARLQHRLSQQPMLAGVKHCNRLDQVMAARELAETGAVEGLCRDADGTYVCGTRSNLFVLRDGALHTPELAACGVRGVMRDRIMALAPALQLALREATIDDATLAAAEGVLLTNSVIGVWPVAQLGGQPLPGSAGLAARILSALGPPYNEETLTACAP